MIQIKIDGKIVQANAGQTILDVAKENNIEIPTLCHDPELNPFGSCWVCAVKVEGKKGFVTACGTNVYDKMEIVTDSDEVIKARQMALELLLSDHYADCEAPCKIACPDHVDVQAYVAAIANNDYHQAVKIIKQTLPMPLSIGRVCPAFCEKECRRTIVEEPIAIRQLKRYAADLDLNDVWSWIPEKEALKNKKIAVVGAGPSGLTCGYYLSNMGYEVDVFESAPQPGGWLRYGIPEYRLPKAILDKEIDLMCTHGMKIHCNVEIGKTDSSASNLLVKENSNASYQLANKTFGLAQLSKDYDAVYMAIGAQKAVDMPVKGSHLKGCYLGVDYLKAVALGNAPEIGKRVAIVGGGNTAIDCARTAKRFGADVTVIYRRTRQEMPADAFEIDAAYEEGINFYLLMNPVEYVGQATSLLKESVGQATSLSQEKLTHIRIEKMVLGEPDKSGRRSPKATGEFITEQFDSVIAAISQIPEVRFLAEEINQIDQTILPLSKWSTIEADENTMYTGIGNIFGGGDFRRGPATAIEAIADGRLAAENIHQWLEKGQFKAEPFRFDSKKEKKLKEVNKKEYEQYPVIERAKMPEMHAEERVTNFEEVELGFSQEQAIEEANRCLECGCQVNETCALRKYASDYMIEDMTLLGDKNRHPIDDSHPFIRRDANKCIKCGRCIRICSEVQGAGVLGYIYRGFTTLVAPEFGESLTTTTCESCGKCIAVCPVGALTEKHTEMKISHLSGDVTYQNCANCGLGCKIKVDISNQKIRMISHPDEKEADFNGRNLCFDGRFGWQVFAQKERMTEPMQKTDGKWQIIDYKEVKNILMQQLLTHKDRHFYISPQMSLEELLIAHSIQTEQKASVSTLHHYKDFTDQLVNTNFRNLRVSSLKQAHYIVIVGEISHTLRTLCRSAQRKGAKLILVNPEESRFNQFADEISPTLESVQMELDAKTIFFYNRNHLNEDQALTVWSKASEICDFEGASGVIVSSVWANQHGLALFDFHQSCKNEEGLHFYWNTDIPEYHSNHCCQLLKESYNVCISSYFDFNNHYDLFIPAPSYLEMDAYAFADDGHLTLFNNPLKSNLFYTLLNVLYETGIIPPTHAEPSLWNNKAEELMSKREINSYDAEWLKAFLGKVALSNKPQYSGDFRKTKINELYLKTK